MPTQDMLLGCTPQINVTVGLDVCGCSTTSPGFLEPGEFGMAPGPLVPGVGAELGGFGTDPCPLAAPGATTIPPGEGLEIGPKATPGTLSSAADPPPPQGKWSDRYHHPIRWNFPNRSIVRREPASHPYISGRSFPILPTNRSPRRMSW